MSNQLDSISSSERLREKTQGRFSCDSIFYPANKTYTRVVVCDRVNVYQAGATDAFDSYISVGQTTLDSAYIDGISVTHGIPGNRVLL